MTKNCHFTIFKPELNYEKMFGQTLLFYDFTWLLSVKFTLYSVPVKDRSALVCRVFFLCFPPVFSFSCLLYTCLCLSLCLSVCPCHLFNHFHFLSLPFRVFLSKCCLCPGRPGLYLITTSPLVSVFISSHLCLSSLSFQLFTTTTLVSICFSAILLCFWASFWIFFWFSHLIYYFGIYISVGCNMEKFK